MKEWMGGQRKGGRTDRRKDSQRISTCKHCIKGTVHTFVITITCKYGESFDQEKILIVCLQCPKWDWTTTYLMTQRCTKKNVCVSSNTLEKAGPFLSCSNAASNHSHTVQGKLTNTQLFHLATTIPSLPAQTHTHTHNWWHISKQSHKLLLHGISILTEARKYVDLRKFFQHQMSTYKKTGYHLSPDREINCMRAVAFMHVNIDFHGSAYAACLLVCSCIIGREGGRDVSGWKGPPKSSGSSCIRVNGTNYKSKAISPHYSAESRRERERPAIRLSVGAEGRKRKAE